MSLTRLMLGSLFRSRRKHRSPRNGDTFGHYTDLLYTQPSALEGAARVLDMCDTLSEYNTAPTPGLADFLALRSDWYAVGADMRRVFDRRLHVRNAKRA